MNKAVAAERRMNKVERKVLERRRRKPVFVSIWPDDCECSARDRCICTQSCKPKRHHISCALVAGGKGGRCTCSATGGKTIKRPSRSKYPLGKPLVVAMTEGQIKSQRDFDRAQMLKAVYLHPDDFHIGQTVWWLRASESKICASTVVKVLKGTVVKVLGDDKHPATVLRAGPVRYRYKPSIYDYCDPEGRKPCVCDLPVGQRTVCQQHSKCPIRSGDATKEDFEPGVKLMQGHSPAVLGGVPTLAVAKSKDGKVLHIDMETRSNVELFPHGEHNRQIELYAMGAHHNFTPKPGVYVCGTIKDSDEYARITPVVPKLADYEVRNGGIYTRRFNVKVAVFTPNSAALQTALGAVFNSCYADKQAKVEAFRRGKLPFAEQIKLRQRDERAANNGWYTHGCGQWVHDRDAPCSVCKPKKKKTKLDDARTKLPKRHAFRHMRDGND